MIEELRGKVVLVTGANGFIGHHLCHQLLQHQVELHGLSRSKRHWHEDGVEWWQCDISDEPTLEDVFAETRPDYVFHLASKVTGSRSQDVIVPTLHANFLSTINLLNLVGKYKCKRIVLAGSLEEPQRNEIPASPYAAAKAASSAYARMFHALYQTPVVMARLFMVYGPAQRDVKKLIPYVTLELLRGGVPKLSSGKRPVDWIYVKDVVDGLLKCALAPGIDGKTVDLGSGELVTIYDLVMQLAQIIHADPSLDFGALPERPFEQVRAANIDQTYELIGWKPQTSLEEGLRKTVDYYRTTLVT
ncbi:MAG: SDR family NAD(P)-dependent oxidoreductase [Anaerolineae bacterium]|nr:SDR family NAD(P)-dependent oxidoreductase [Anaerolineae bacterium]